MVDVKQMGQNIRSERKRQLLTIEALAERAEITENFLGKIERGEGMPSLSTVVKLAQALNVSIDQLVFGVEESSQHRFINSLMEINGLGEQERNHFIDFIQTNIRFFHR